MPEPQPLNLADSQQIVLWFLVETGGTLTARQIADRNSRYIHYDRVYSGLKGLERKGLVDRHARHWSASKAGYDFYHAWEANKRAQPRQNDD